MKYRCIKPLILQMHDDDGFALDREEGLVPINSVWYESDMSIISGEIHLECQRGCDDFGWIEISRETLSECFEIVES